jgi:hypothetical protein
VARFLQKGLAIYGSTSDRERARAILHGWAIAYARARSLGVGIIDRARAPAHNRSRARACARAI